MCIRDRYTGILKYRLTDSRFNHSLAVRKEAMRLAKKYGADIKKAELAGLLHDIMKDTPPEEQLNLSLIHIWLILALAAVFQAVSLCGL